jgi:hypothetical protein
MATEKQDDYSEIIYGVEYDRLSRLEKYRIDIIIQRREEEKINSKEK